MKNLVDMSTMGETTLNKLDDPMALHQCPKCTRIQARYTVERQVDLVMSCTCGFRKVMYTEHQNGMSTTHVLPQNKVNMPRAGSKLSKCLNALVSFDRYQATTEMVAARIEGDKLDIASQLMVLQNKGLIDKINDNRGKGGGSLWRLTDRASTFLRLGEA